MRRLPAPALMVLASLLFALMGVCVKLASTQYGAGEIVFYRALVGVGSMVALMRWSGTALATPVPAMHFWRSLSGVCALCLWFYSIGGLPLATAMTLNYMSGVWMALFLIGGALMVGGQRVDSRLVAAVLVGFAGVAMVLQPTMTPEQMWHGLAGLLSGMLAAMAYLQVTALGRVGEPEQRIVLYFSVGGVVAGAGLMMLYGPSSHTLRGLGLLLAIGLLATTAQLMMTRAYAVGRTLSNAALQYLGIAFSFVFGVWLFGDPVTGLALLGMLLIAAAGLGATVVRHQAQVPNKTPGEA